MYINFTIDNGHFQHKCHAINHLLSLKLSRIRQVRRLYDCKDGGMAWFQSLEEMEMFFSL
jgi:hypothetical protein